MAATAIDAQLYTNLTTAPASSFTLKGGLYGVAVQGTMGTGGQPSVQILGPDGSNYITVASFTQAAYQTVNLIAGTFRLVIGTATAIYAEIVRIPTQVRLDELRQAQKETGLLLKQGQLLDFELQRYSTNWLFCLISYFNREFAALCSVHHISGEIKKRFSGCAASGIIVCTFDALTVGNNPVAVPSIEEVKGHLWLLQAAREQAMGFRRSMVAMRLDSIRAAFYQAAHVVAFLCSASGFCAAMPSYWLENSTERAN